ncbi:tyrosyl-tRNA synthetase [Hyphomonas neptunium ATCC 15444]|uniref:Tyrosine--tRNA ligase n=2 Tax=Hyphomonas TaxID=85 RepID=Q0BYX9_HYPNA|nr:MULTISPECIES: tyrosine--tRNA ligase [Hyphomonas]ABI78141.1 tyrosyl-tRNA synthetase [Hyphomonas neptunium ATCC 15444]KCZ91439.1 tyrosyl-tRNA ligase [Hyphomonas hirschiana VP5]
MSDYKSEFLRELSWRGFIKDTTHKAELDAYCSNGTPVAYVGYDATADSLHVGHLMTIMMLRIFQRHGGKPIALMGGGTTKVGDPTDKEKSRPLLTDDQINANIAGIKTAFEPFLRFGDGANDAIMVNNNDWLGELGYLEMLRAIGVYFTINTMVKQDTVRRRLEAEQPYTFLEFNYLLMQSYDFLELFRRHGCRMQLGGSDQWGNIVGGVDLVHKAEGGDAFGVTAHLVTTSSGVKMGKTVGGAVWLNADRKSPYEYWQFWRNTEDADVGKFLRLFTDLGREEIERLEALEGSAINDAKIALANAATTLLHGAAAAAEAEAAAKAVFAGGASADALPTALVPQAELEAGMLVAAACAAAGLSKSNGEARRLIEQGAIRVNDALVSDPNAKVSMADMQDGAIKLSAGKKRHALVKAG